MNLLLQLWENHYTSTYPLNDDMEAQSNLPMSRNEDTVLNRASSITLETQKDIVTRLAENGTHHIPATWNWAGSIANMLNMHRCAEVHSLFRNALTQHYYPLQTVTKHKLVYVLWAWSPSFMSGDLIQTSLKSAIICDPNKSVDLFLGDQLFKNHRPPTVWEPWFYSTGKSNSVYKEWETKLQV